MTRTVAIVGPTAVGKTALSLDLAEALDAEIVNADSMQVYRGMDIGTAKLPPGERRGIPHHMIDVWDVRTSSSVAVYQTDARAVIRAIHDRGRVALVVGGSGLFVSGVLDDMRFPGSDPALRTALEVRLAHEGAAALHAQLAQLSPATAADVLPSNGRRIVRALEVIALTGRPPVTTFGPLPEVVPAVRIGLTRNRQDLDERIEHRVDDMFEAGFVAEVEHLVKGGLREGRTACKALGYQQILASLDGVTTMEEARVATVVGTRRLVRRQQAWFNRDPRIRWMPADEVSVHDVLEWADLQSCQT